MDIIAEKIEKIFTKRNVEILDIELFRFGLSKLLANVIVISIIIGVSLFLHTTMYTMILLATLLFLRSKTGGYHFDSSLICFIFSVIMPIVIGWIFQRIEISRIVIITLYVLSSICTILLSPVDHPNKRLDKQDKVYFKKKTIQSVILLSVLVILLESIVQAHDISKFITVGILVNFLSIVFTLIRNNDQCRDR